MIILLLLFLLTANIAQAADFWVSPTGNDTGNNCTSRDAPCTINRVFATSEPMPSAGETWNLMNGTYPDVNNKTIDGTLGSASGSAGSPIILKSENERGARLVVSAATAYVLAFRHVSYWDLQGVIFQGHSSTSADNNSLYLHDVSFFNVRRNIFFEHNGTQAVVFCWNENNPALHGCNDTVFEENELLRYATHGIVTYASDRVAIRRNGCFPRDWARTADLPGGIAIGDCAAIYHGSDGYLEDNISEGNYQRAGCISTGSWWPHTLARITVSGNICYNGSLFQLKSADQAPPGMIAQDNVAIAPAVPLAGAFGHGIWNRAAGTWTIRNNTAIGFGNDAVGNAQYRMNYDGEECGAHPAGPDANNSYALQNNVLIGNGVTSLAVQIDCSGVQRAISYTATYNTASPAFSPTTNVTNTVSLSSNPFTACPGFVGASATYNQVRGTGASGANIGADTRWIYVNGVKQTSLPRWDAASQEIKLAYRGIQVTGLNGPSDGASIHNFGSRFHPGCNFAVELPGYDQPVASEVYTTKHFRCRVWNHDLVGNTNRDWYTAEDASCGVQNTNGKIAIVWAIDCTGTLCGTTGFDTEFQVNGGSWTDTTDSTALNAISYDNTQNGGATHGASIPASLLTNPHPTFIAGKVLAQDSSYPTTKFVQDSTTNYLGSFAIKNGLTAGSTQICIRPKQDTGTAISHDVTACVNVVNPAGQAP